MALAKASLVNADLGAETPQRARCRRKFLRFFPRAFKDEKYWAWERGYKWAAHERWMELLPKAEFTTLLSAGEFHEIASRAVRTLAGTNLIFSFENMALRDAVKVDAGARAFATGLYDLIYGEGRASDKFDSWCDTIADLPKKQSRVLTHPIATVFGFIAQPKSHIFLKPTVTKRAAVAYGYDFKYNSRPGWETYRNFLEFAQRIRTDLKDLKPKDMIDIQSFIWVLGSDEYR